MLLQRLNVSVVDKSEECLLCLIQMAALSLVKQFKTIISTVMFTRWLDLIVLKALCNIPLQESSLENACYIDLRSLIHSFL